MERLSQLSLKRFCLTAPKNFLKNASTVALVSGIENFYKKKGITSRSSAEIFCPAVPENFVEEPFNAVFQEISVSEKLMDKCGWGSVEILPSEIFVS